MHSHPVRLPVIAGPELTATPAELARLEAQVFALQATVAMFYVAGALFGAFGPVDGWVAVAAGWIVGYHAVRAVYVAGWAMTARRIDLVEFFIPALDVSCITVGWAVLGDPHSPFWAVFMIAIVAHARHIHGKGYALLTAFTVANMVAVRVLGAASSGGPWLDSDLGIMVVLTGVMAGFAHVIGNAWQRAEARARTLADTDTLTGVANRRAFVANLMEVTADPRAEFSVLMVDVDNFKKLNDEHGHEFGDSVLTRVAQTLALHVRAGDRLARYGGDEFVVLMPGTGANVARTVAERLRMAAAADLPVTITVGCATRQPGEDTECVMRRADALLLQAKRGGKNAILVADFARTA